MANKPLSKAMWKSIANVKWEKQKDIVYLFLTDEKHTFVPRMVKKYGKENFEAKNDKLFLFNREIVTDDKRRKEILDQEENKYGGTTKSHARIMRKYINVSRTMLSEFYGGSERRQLKAQYRSSKKNNTFIHSSTPGALQIDLTFYRGQKIAVFGAIDIFSRWAYYERVPNKKASLVIKAIQRCIKAFESVSGKHRVYKLSSDGGSEFIHKTTAKWLKESHIHYDKKVGSRKLIETLNRTLRHYIERVGWDTIAELDKLIKDFIETYNDTKHSSTKKTPNDLVSIEQKKDIKAESKQQVKKKQERIAQGKGYALAKLSVGDNVRLYDPRRTEIKAEEKAKLKGKIKLSEDDFVKQYTSSHRGQAAHWTKKVYKITKIIKGTRAPRYKVEGKKDVYLRSELQKVRAVTKEDPRKKIIEKRKAKAEKEKVVQPPVVRAKKFLRKEIIVKFKDEEKAMEEPATVLVVYKNHLIVLFDTKPDPMLTYVTLDEVVRMSGKTYKADEVKGWIKDNKEGVERAKGEIDDDIQELKDKADEYKPP